MSGELRDEEIPEEEVDDGQTTLGLGAFGPDLAEPSRASDAGSGPQVMEGLRPGSLIADRYRLEARLARGGMGSVWAATDERLDRQVAIKLMSPHLFEEPEARLRFDQEARAAARIHSPHVVTIFDHGVSDDVPFMVFERLEGEDLYARLKREERISLAECGRLLADAARALSAAHGAGVVHRDIKPQNLFLHCPPPSAVEVLKLLDFGVAKQVAGDGIRTKTGVVVGSFQYMSPEQVRGTRNVDARSDLYSLGSVFYRALTGSRPFEGEMHDIMYAIATRPPRPPTKLAPELPSWLDGFFAKALARDVDARFQTAQEMSDAFQEGLASGPAATEPERTRAPRPASSSDEAGWEDVGSDALEAVTDEKEDGVPPSDQPTRLSASPIDKRGPDSERNRPSDAPTAQVAAAAMQGFSAQGLSDASANDVEAASPWLASGARRAANVQAAGAGTRPGWWLTAVGFLGLVVVLVYWAAVHD